MQQLMLRDVVPWQPLLTEEEVQRAQGYYGGGERMRRVAQKLRAGQPIKVQPACCVDHLIQWQQLP